MEIGNIVNINCIDLNHQGYGVSKLDNFVLFTKGLLVGETAKVKITKITKNYGYADIVELISTSKDRVKPICPIFGLCGGCDLMHLSYQKQLEYKLESVNQTLRRLGNIDYNISEIFGMDEPYYYRNKVQVPFQMIDGRVECGFYEKGTHNIVPFKNCFIQPNQATEICLFIRDFYNEFNLTAYNELTKKGNLRHVLIRNTANNDYMVVLITNEVEVPKSKELINRLKAKFPNIKSIIHNINNKPTNVILGPTTKLLFGDLVLKEELLNLEFILGYNSFFQTNYIQTEKLYKKVIEFVDAKASDVIVDGYCGVGTISLLLANKAKQVYGIEIIKAAIDDAKVNAELNNITNVKFIVGKTEAEINNINGKINTIVIDPPRKGCEKVLLESIIKRGIEKVVYVSCNEATLARDLQILSNKYKIVDAAVFDMFPNTTHIESCTVLIKKS